MDGNTLGKWQDMLADVWNDPNRGPSDVYAILTWADREAMIQLLMANIGARAATAAR